MKVDRVLCRVAVGLAVIALVGLSVYLLGERSSRSRPAGVAQQAAPDGSSNEPGDTAGLLSELLGSTALLTSATTPMAPLEPVAPVPSLPPLGMFTSDEPLDAGANTAAELVSLQGQVSNGLMGSVSGSAMMGAMSPLMFAQPVAQGIQQLIDASLAAALAHTDPFF